MDEHITELIALPESAGALDQTTLDAVYDGLPNSVREACEGHYTALKADVIHHLRAVRDALAPYGRFAGWCQAHGLKPQIARNWLDRATWEQVSREQRHQAIVEQAASLTPTSAPASAAHPPPSASPSAPSPVTVEPLPERVSAALNAVENLPPDVLAPLSAGEVADIAWDVIRLSRSVTAYASEVARQNEADRIRREQAQRQIERELERQSQQTHSRTGGPGADADARVARLLSRLCEVVYSPDVERLHADEVHDALLAQCQPWERQDVAQTIGDRARGLSVLLAQVASALE